MRPMTTPDNTSRADFNRPGAVDLSALKQQAEAQRSAPGGTAPGGGAAGGYVADLADVQELQGYLQASMQHVVIIEFHSERAEGGAQMSQELKNLANSSGGKWLLVRVDCDQHADVAQQLGVQAIPTVVAVIGGQLMPLFQGVQPAEAVKQVVDQVLQAAVANGIVGQAQPVASQAAGGEGEEPASDPRFAEADAALARGDYEAAVAAFDEVLAQTPGDAEASAGRAQASLLARTTAAEQPSEGVDAELAAADRELMSGDAAAAFDRLIAVIRTTSGDERDRVRVRLLELFETRGASDPAVIKARRDLTSALF